MVLGCHLRVFVGVFMCVCVYVCLYFSIVYGCVPAKGAVL